MLQKRGIGTYKPAVVSRSEKEIMARGYNLKTDFWRLEQAGTDPDHEGRGPVLLFVSNL